MIYNYDCPAWAELVEAVRNYVVVQISTQQYAAAEERLAEAAFEFAYETARTSSDPNVGWFNRFAELERKYCELMDEHTTLTETARQDRLTSIEWAKVKDKHVHQAWEAQSRLEAVQRDANVALEQRRAADQACIEAHHVLSQQGRRISELEEELRKSRDEFAAAHIMNKAFVENIGSQVKVEFHPDQARIAELEAELTAMKMISFKDLYIEMRSALGCTENDDGAIKAKMLAAENRDLKKEVNEYKDRIERAETSLSYAREAMSNVSNELDYVEQKLNGQYR